jgi:hypothetical protein
MTQIEVENRIREIFSENYYDLGIYRWLNRNKNWIKPFFAMSLILVLSLALTCCLTPIAIWAFLFIGTISIGGIDHFIIGVSLKKILRVLESENIIISLDTLLKICSDILPK